MIRIFALSLSFVIAGCNQTAKVTSTPREKPQALMLRVAKQVQTCWFKKSDPALKPYKMATELDSFSGKPRILIVPRSNPRGLPKLVAQAESRGGRTNFTTFGPLLTSAQGPRLNGALNAWAQGSKTC